ncbi:hypothetical protein FSP39_003697, partial [Pinctada imbricata]
VGHPNVEIGCTYSNAAPGIDVRTIELQKEWPRGNGVFQTIAIFFPPGGNEPSFSPSFVANQIKDRSTLIQPTNDSMTAKLLIDDIQCEDHGTYKCSVQYHSNSGSGSVAKTVIMKTVATAEAPYAAPVSSVSGGLVENEIMEFTCKADVGKPAGKIHWWLYRINKTMPIDLTNNAIETPVPLVNPGICDSNVVSTLPFHVNKDDNYAKIRCSVDQELLTSPTGKPQDMPYKETDIITVFYPVRRPEITKNPDKVEYDIDIPSISIKCTTIGNPNPFNTNDDEKAKVTWYYKKSMDSQEIFAIRIPHVQVTKRELKLQQLTVSQSGIYVCEVQNSFKGDNYIQRTEVPIRIVNPNHKLTAPSVVEDLDDDDTNLAASIVGDSVIVALLLGIFFLVYKQAASTEDHMYVDADEVTNKRNAAKQNIV